MLILQRKAGESLLIGDSIRVTVASVEAGGRVRLAIDAPREMQILRSELKVAVDTNQAAAQEEATPGELMSFLEHMAVPDGNGQMPPQKKRNRSTDQ